MEELVPRKSFTKIIAVLDVIMPGAVIISILGLMLEYTFLNELLPNFLLGKGIIGALNMIFDIFFAIDVVLKTIAYSHSGEEFKRYMTKGLGWVDWLAAIPGFMIPFEIFSGAATGGELLRQFKIARIGKFLRIIRLLRILRIFKFLEKMNKDSVFIQKHIMALVLSITLLSIVAIGIMDTAFSVGPSTKIELAQTIYKDEVQGMSHDEILNFAETKDKVIGSLYKSLKEEHDTGMLILLLLLTILLMMIIFYFGPRLAKDIRRVQLVIDSVDADDYFLVQQELETVKNETGSEDFQEGEDEMISLIKVVGRIPEKMEEIEFKEGDLELKEETLNIKEEELNQRDKDISNAVSQSIEGGASASGQSLDSDDLKQLADAASLKTIKRGAKNFLEVTRRMIREEFAKWQDRE